MIQTHQPYEVQCTKCGFDWDNWSGKSIHGIQPDDKLICDRCKKPIDGFRSEGFTAGYYDTTTLEPWGKYANSDEKFVCDACMWADPRYIADYGDNRPVKS